MFAPNPQVSNYLISLDAIWDTRLGVVAMLGGDALDKLEAMDYNKRSSDEGLHSIEGYTEAWAKRTTEVLRYSTRNQFFDTMCKLINDDILDHTVGMPNRKFNLFLNTYPYRLTAEEKEEYCYVLHILLGGRVNVETRYLGPMAMSPSNLAGGCYIAVAMYDFTEWVKMHFEALYKTPIKEMVFVAPCLKEIGAVEPEETADIAQLKSKITAAEAVEIALMDVLALKYYPIEEFTSLLYKLAKEEG